MNAANSTATSGVPASSPIEHYRSARTRGRALAGLCRFQISRVPVLIMACTAITAGTTLSTMVAGAGLIAAGCAVGAALNDRADVLSDRLNQRADRPLASGVLGPTDLWAVVSIASLVVAASELWLPQPTGFLVAAAAAFVAWASACEPLALQRRGLAGLLALALGYLVLPILLVIGIDGFWTVAPLALLGAGVLAHKDIRDEVGDRGAGKRTMLVQMGYRNMSRVSALLAVAGTTALWLTLGTGWWLATAALTVGALLALAHSGHSSSVWLFARVALVVTAALVGIQTATAITA